MAWFFVKQPNGLLARYSDIVDNFTHLDMTVEDAVRECVATHGIREDAAKAKVQRGLDDLPIYAKMPVVGDGLDRWREALDSILSVHGQAAVDEVTKNCSGEPS